MPSSSPICCPEGSLPGNRNDNNHEDSRYYHGSIITISSSSLKEKVGSPSSVQSMRVYCTYGKNTTTKNKEIYKSYNDNDDMILSYAKRIVIVFSDVFGFDSGRHFEFADNLASLLSSSEATDDEKPITTAVLIPDIFQGDNVLTYRPMLGMIGSGFIELPLMLYKIRYRTTSMYLPCIHDLLIPWIQQQQQQQGVQVNPHEKQENSKIRNNHFIDGLSCVGFCFGGWLVSKLLSSNTSDSCIWKCGVAIHPSFIVERIVYSPLFNIVFSSFKKLALLEENIFHSISNKDIPFLLMPAGNDSDDIKPPDGKFIKILQQQQSTNERNNKSLINNDKEEKEKIDLRSGSILFDNMSHGFVSRGDSSIEEIRIAQTKAERLTAKFLEMNHH